MVWFNVDDELAFEAATVKAGNAAMGLWVRAGAHCMKKLTDGFVDDAIVTLLGSAAQRAKLVRVGLWTEVPGGVQFTPWTQTPAKKILEARRDAAGRKQRSREGFSRKPQVSELGHRGSHGGSHAGSHGGSHTTPLPLSFSGTEGGEVTVPPAQDQIPPSHDPKCEQPCPVCRDHRLAVEAARKSAESAAVTDRGAEGMRIRGCRDCDGQGWAYHPDGRHLGPAVPARKCDHTIGVPDLRIVNG